MAVSIFKSRALFASPLLAALALAGCNGFLGVDIPEPPWLADDDDDDTDDDDAGDDLFVTLSGTVVATARESGLPLSDWAYLNCAGKTVLYVVDDPSDLSAPVAKFTMDTPGPWDLTVDIGSGPYHVIGLTDDGNRIIGTEDVLRAYAYNPVTADEDQTGIELVMDLPCNSDGSGTGAGGGWGGNGGGFGGGGGGGGGGGNDNPANVTVFSGTVVLNDLSNNEIMITANNADGTVGPIEWQFMPGAGAFSIEVANNRPATALIAYHDTDGNGLFEASDMLGEPAGNPYTLGAGDVGGITIDIPSGSGEIPSPPVYVGVQGTVAMDNFPGGTIYMFASAGSPEGVTFSSAVLSTPGSFELSAPIDAGAVAVWGVLDEDQDGFFDTSVDPFDTTGPTTVPASGLSGIALDLSGPSPNTVSGTINYGSTPDPADILYVGLYADSSYAGDPIYVERYLNLSFPHQFTISNVGDGTWYAAAVLDIGGDNPEEPGLEDLWAVFGGGAINVSGGQNVGGITFGF